MSSGVINEECDYPEQDVIRNVLSQRMVGIVRDRIQLLQAFSQVVLVDLADVTHSLWRPGKNARVSLNPFAETRRSFEHL